MQFWLSQRVASLTLAPAVLLMLFIIFSAAESLNTYSSASLTSVASKFALLSNNALAEIQKERGISVGFVSSQGQNFAQQVKAQRSKVDAALDAAFNFDDLNNLDNIDSLLIRPLRQQYQKIQSLRAQVDQLKTSPVNIVTEYSVLTEILLEFNGELVSISQDALGKQKFILLFQLAHLQEKSGLERALLSNIFAAKNITEKQKAKFETLTSFQQAKMADLLTLATTEFKPVLEAFIASNDQKSVTKYRDQIALGDSAALNYSSEEWFDASSKRIAAISKLTEELFEQLSNKANAETSDAIFVLLLDAILILITMTLAGLVYWILQLRKRQSNELRRKLKQAISQQDLTVVIEKISNDDLGLVAGDINTLFTSFKDDFRSFQVSAEEIAAASHQSASASAQTSSNIQRQQQLISGSLLSAETLSAGINEDLNTVMQLTEYAKESSTIVIEGEATVGKATQGIRATADEVKKIGVTIDLLNERVADILRMVDVIRSVADQTNLLALNAAIEAARAGEQGRGFAVVADEVRALAKRTQDSTLEIANVVDELNESSKTAFSAIERGSETANQAVQYSDEINSVLAKITGNMQHLANLTVNVDQSARQQSASLDQITNSVRDVDKVSEDNANNAEQTAAAAYELSSSAESMLTNIKRYKVA